MKKVLLVILSLVIIFVGIRLYNLYSNNYISYINNINDIVGINFIDEGVLDITYTTNMVHAENKIKKKSLNLSIDDSYIYLGDLKANFNINDYFYLVSVDDLNSCKKTSSINKVSYMCDNYNVDVYLNLINKINKIVINKDNDMFIYSSNSLSIKTNKLNLNYTDITTSSYHLVINNIYSIYYTNSSNKKYSVLYNNDINFNIIDKNDSIILSLPVDTPMYNNIEVSYSKKEIDKLDNYTLVSIDEVIDNIITSEVHDLFSTKSS